MNISVAIPTYNRAELIGHTLESILSQTVSVSDINICDDGSTDETTKALRSFSKYINYKKIDNSGPAAARKEAIAMCQSNWIALCDSDDLWNKDHLSKFVETIDLFPTTEFYFSNFSTLGDITLPDKLSEAPEGWLEEITGQKSNSSVLLNEDSFLSLLKFQPIFPSATVFRSELYEKLGGINTSFSRMPSEDAHLIRRLVANGVTACQLQPTVQIRKHDGNFSKHLPKNLLGRISILQALCEGKDIPERFIEPTRNEISHSYASVFDISYWEKDFSTAREVYQFIPRELKTVKRLVKYVISIAST